MLLDLVLQDLVLQGLVNQDSVPQDLTLILNYTHRGWVVRLDLVMDLQGWAARLEE